MLNEVEKEKLRDLTVDVLLELRAAYLRTPGVNALKHWDQLQDRMRLAARTATSPEEWSTVISRSLKVGAPNVTCSAAIMALSAEVFEKRCATAWLDLVEAEYGYLMAKTRLLSEQRREGQVA